MRLFNISLLLIASLLTGGCAYYSNRLDVQFEIHGYTNHGSHKPIDLWWKATLSKTHSLGFIYVITKDYGTDSILKVGFIQMPDTMERVEIDSIALHPPTKISKPIAPIPSPQSIQFEKQSFPLFDDVSPKGRSVPRDYAELEITLDLPPRKKPYSLHLTGRYIDRSGKASEFTVDETIHVHRDRKIQSIANAW